MEKQEKYKHLVEKRKRCKLCKSISNPAQVAGGIYDSSEIGPWSLWQGNINTELLIVGQDWGDTSYFKKWNGKDKPSGNPTNENLQKLLEHIGIRISKPCESQDQVVFLTNLILCLKEGGLQAPVDDQWLLTCTRKFFKPMIDIINPAAILGLGKKVSEAILDMYEIQYPQNKRLADIICHSPYPLTISTVFFPLYHCGAGSINRNRSIDEQKADWTKVREWLIRKDYI